MDDLQSTVLLEAQQPHARNMHLCEGCITVPPRTYISLDISNIIQL